MAIREPEGTVKRKDRANLRDMQHYEYPDTKVQGDNMGIICGLYDPGGPHIGPMNFDIWVLYIALVYYSLAQIKCHMCWYLPTYY